MITINDELEIERGEGEEMSDDVKEVIDLGWSTKENMEKLINGDKPKVAGKANEIKKDLQEINKEKRKDRLKDLPADTICKQYLAFMFTDVDPDDIAAIYYTIKKMIQMKRGIKGEELSKAASLIATEAIDFIKSSIDLSSEED